MASYAQEKKQATDAAPTTTVENSGEEGGEGQNNLSSEYIITNNYVHNWEKFPGISVTQMVMSGQDYSYSPPLGRATVVIFISSWCEPCQFMIEEIIFFRSIVF